MLSYGNPIQGLSEINVTATENCAGRDISYTDNTMQFSVSSLLRLGQKNRNHSDIESNEGNLLICTYC